MRFTKSISLALALMLAVFGLFGCAKEPEPAEIVSEPTSGMVVPQEKTKVNVIAISGPTGMGMVKLMEDAEAGTASNDYTFSLTSTPSDVVGKISSGEVDIAAIPANLAATLYAKTEGKIQILAINTLSNLYIVQTQKEITSIKDLEGKSIAVSGQGSTPEYVLNYILTANDLEGKVTVNFYEEHSEVVAQMAAGKETIALLPQPFVTVAQGKLEDLAIAVNIADAWKDACQITGDSGDIVMGCVVARSEFVEEHKDAVDAFLTEYLASVGYISTNTEDAAKLVVKYGILADEKLAATALPSCGIAFISGTTMQDSLKPFLEILFDANPAAVGGALPGDDFYYLP